MSLMKLIELNKTYTVGEAEVIAIKELNLDINEGDFIVILGRSGSGKSTLLSLMAGLEKPSSGDIIYENTKLNELSQEKLAKMRRNNVGIIFQHFYLLDSLTAFENVELPLIISGKSSHERTEIVMTLLKMMELDDRGAHYPSELSGGERQRVAIARSLANRAKILFADEPTGDLDSKTGKLIINLLKDLNGGRLKNSFFNWKPTILLVTHDTSILDEGMRVITLSDGKIVSDKTKNNSKISSGYEVSSKE